MKKLGKKKKMILVVLAVVVVLAAAGAAAYRTFGKSGSTTVEVIPMDLLNSADYFDSSSSLSGTISSDYVQEVYLNGTQEVSKVYVKEGDSVKEGDKLLKYDVEEEELNVKLQKLEIKGSKLEIASMEEELAKMKGTTPTGSSEADTEEDTEEEEIEDEDTDDEEGEFTALGAESLLETAIDGQASPVSAYALAAEENSTEQTTASTEQTTASTEQTTASTEQTTASTEPTTAATDSTAAQTGTAEKIYHKIKDTAEHTTTSGDGSKESSPLVYLLVKTQSGTETEDALIYGSVINQLIANGQYAVFREYQSEEAYNQGQEPAATFTVYPGMLFTKSVDDDAQFTIEKLNARLVTVTKVKIKPYKKTVTAGKSYTFTVKLSGTNTDSATVTWTLKGNKSEQTTLADGVLNVASDETAAKLTIQAEAAGTTATRKVKVKAAKGGSGSGDSGGSDIDIDAGDDEEDYSSYTADELTEAIADKEEEIAQAKEELKEAKINYKEAKKEIEAATVTSKINGKVTVAYSADSMPTDSSAVIVVRAEDGMYVNAYVSEMDLDTVKVGGTITCTSWDTGESYDAEVIEISDYPASSVSVDTYSSNPNSSYYPIVAYIEDAEDLSSGSSVEISYDSQSMGTVSEDAIYLQKAYVRTEGSKSYVYKQGEDGKLTKQYVKTGATVYGQYIEIKSGLTLTDNIAFPYGKSVKEGAKTEVTEDDANIIY